MEYIETPEYTFDRTEISKSDHYRIRRCWDLYGDVSDRNHFQLAAGIYRSGWLAGGANERRSHAKRYPYREALHAEQVAIMTCRTNLAGTTLYVTRYSEKERKFKLALPCFWCMHKIIDAEIYKVIYSTDDGGIAAFKVNSVDIAPIYSLDIDYHLVKVS